MVDIYRPLHAALLRLYPPLCLLCDAPGQRIAGLDLCSHCQNSLPWAGHYCHGCGLPMPAGIPTADERCGRCLVKPPPFVRCHVVFGYQRPVDWLVSRMKFGRSLAAARLLGQLLSGAVISDADLIIPVPLHKTRLRQRGFNQALEVAKPLAKQLHRPLLRERVRRERATLAQSSGLSVAARHSNLRGAFSLHGAFSGEHVLLVDDVMTTGATLLELTRVLLNAGAGKVSVCCVARTPRPDQRTGL